MSSILCDALLKSYIATYWDVCFFARLQYILRLR